jgi:hypothetical protein
MDSVISSKEENWFLRVCHHISNAAYANMLYCHAATVRMRTLRSHSTYNIVSFQSPSLHGLNKHTVSIKLNSQCQHKDKITHTNRISRHPGASLAQEHILPSGTFHLSHSVPLPSNIPSLLPPPHFAQKSSPYNRPRRRRWEAEV